MTRVQKVCSTFLYHNPPQQKRWRHVHFTIILCVQKMILKLIGRSGHVQNSCSYIKQPLALTRTNLGSQRIMVKFTSFCYGGFNISTLNNLQPLFFFFWTFLIRQVRNLNCCAIRQFVRESLSSVNLTTVAAKMTKITC